jgi:aspartate aminotransferase-like enzyme
MSTGVSHLDPRQYHHTMSSTLLYVWYEALTIIEEETLEARWARLERALAAQGRCATA